MSVKNISWQYEPLCRVDQERVADISTTLLVPGYKFKNFPTNSITEIANKMKIFY
jgi:hypothetical protein